VVNTHPRSPQAIFTIAPCAGLGMVFTMNAVDQEFIFILVLWGLGLLLLVGVLWFLIRNAVRRARSREPQEGTHLSD